MERGAERLLLIDGAVEPVERMAAHWPLGLASSSNGELIDRALEVSGLAPYFRATVSSEEVERGKPAPDVYLEAARRLEVEPSRCAAIEDSANGIRSAHAADALALAHVVLESIKELTPETLGATRDSSRRER